MNGVAISHSRAGRLLRHFLADESGTTAIEYALIAAGVGATIASVVYGMGEKVRTNLYDKISNAV